MTTTAIDFRTYDVEVFIDGKPKYIMTVNSTTPEKAARRCRIQTMSLHRQTEMERITTGTVVDLGPMH